jgi:hypothetical protein
MMVAGYALSLALIGILIALHYRLNRNSLKIWYWPALALRIVAGLAVGCMYVVHYGAGDPLNFSADAKILVRIAREDPVRYLQFLWSGSLLEGFVNEQYRSVFMVKVLSLIYLITFGNFWIASILLSFFSFAGAWFLVRVIESRWRASFPAAVAFLFWPSIVVWSSGVLKETIAIPCLFIMVGCLIKIRDNPRQWYLWLGFVLAAWLGWKLKYYNVGVFLSAGLTALLVRYMTGVLQITNRYGQVLLWLIVFGVLTGAVTFLHPNFNLQALPEVIAYNYELFTKMSGGSGTMVFPGLEPTWASIAAHAPNALFSGLFRPFVWEAKSWLAIVGAIENIVLFAMFIWALLNFVRKPACKEPLLFLAAAIAVLILGVILPLSTPNFGTLSRYRIGYLSFFVFYTLQGIPLLERKVDEFLHGKRDGL